MKNGKNRKMVKSQGRKNGETFGLFVQQSDQLSQLTGAFDSFSAKSLISWKPLSPKQTGWSCYYQDKHLPDLLLCPPKQSAQHVLYTQIY